MRIEIVQRQLANYLRSVYIRPIRFGPEFTDHAYMGRFYGRNNACIGWPREPIRSIVKDIRGSDHRLSEKAIHNCLQNVAITLVEENLVSEGGNRDLDVNVDSLLEELTKDAVNKQAEHLLYSLQSSVGEYVVFVPLQGIVLDISEFEIGGGILYPRESQQLKSDMEIFSFPNDIGNEIIDSYANLSAYFVCTEVGDRQMSAHFGRDRALNAIHLLRFFLTPSSLKSQREHQQIRLLGEPECDGRFVFVRTTDTTNESARAQWTQELTSHRKYRLGVEQINVWTHLPFAQVHRAILDPMQKDQSVQARIARAVDWFSYAVATHEIDQKFLGYAVALEALLTDSTKPDPSISWGSITQKLAERCAFLLSDSYDGRVFVVKEAKELYGMRSKIVHGGLSASEENVFRIQQLCREAILAFASFEFESWAIFGQWIDSQKYGVGQTI